jgi:SPP1 family phage portal protein
MDFLNIQSDVLDGYITKHATRREKMIQMYKGYKGEVPILNRTIEDETKPNNKLRNDFRGMIVDQKVSYMYGVPVSFQIDQADTMNETDYKTAYDELQRFTIRNNMKKVVKEAGKMASICGYGAWIAYIDETNGKERVLNGKPWEIIFIYNGDDRYAIRYFMVDVINAKGEVEQRQKAVCYDAQYEYHYVKNEDGVFEFDRNETDQNTGTVGYRLHQYTFTPVIEVPNNEERLGDFEKVEEDIDAYDRIVSDAQNEIEAFRNSYMVFTGEFELTNETIQAMKQTGAIKLPKDAQVAYLTKQINDAFFENQKKTLEENIYKFSKRINYNDEAFSGGAESGESRKWKLLDLDNDSINSEVEIEVSLRNLFQVICSSWNVKGIALDYIDIFFTFKRNLPVDLLYEAEVQAKWNGLISDKSRLALSRAVDDVDYEIQALEEQNEDAVNLDDVSIDEGDGTNGTTTNVR